MNDIFFEENSTSTPSDLSLSLFKNFLYSSDITIQQLGNDKSKVIVEIELN